MRALVISDTHFGAWTGRDQLREEFFLERLAPRLRDRGLGNGAGSLPSEAHFDAVGRDEARRQVSEQPLSSPAFSRPALP